MLGKVVFGQLVVLWFLRSLSGIWLISNRRLESGPIKPMRNAQLSCLFWTCIEFAKHFAALDPTRLTRLWGVFIAPDGNMEAEKEYLRGLASTWAEHT